MTTATADDELLDSAGFADVLGVKLGTLHTFRSRGILPEPDAMIGKSPAWHRSTVDAWKATRPGRGKGGGRPRKTAEATP